MNKQTNKINYNNLTENELINIIENCQKELSDTGTNTTFKVKRQWSNK